MDLPKDLTELRDLCQKQIDRANGHQSSESELLIYGDRSEYKRGGVDALKGVVQLIDGMIKNGAVTK